MRSSREGGARSLRQTTVDTGVVDDLGDQTGPAALVGCAETAACVAVEELVEPEVVFPVFVEVEEVGAGVHGATAFVVAYSAMVIMLAIQLIGEYRRVRARP